MPSTKPAGPGREKARDADPHIAITTWLANASEVDRRDMTAAARKAFADRWEQKVNPDGHLSPEERARRADHAKAAHFQRMALKSLQSRRVP